MCVAEIRTIFNPLKLESFGETYWGLFKFTEQMFCELNSSGGYCNVKCNELEVDYDKNAHCAAKAFRKNGLNTWSLQKNECENSDFNFENCL